MKKKQKKPQPGRKPGRPLGTTIAPAKHKTRKSIRYTDAEWNEIVTAAKSTECTASKLIRTASLRIARRINRRSLDSHGGAE